MKKTALITLIFSILFLSCDNKDDRCQDTICTTEFVIITTAVKDQNQNPVIFDDYQIINLRDNSTVTTSLSGLELESFLQEGIYPLMDDLTIENNQELNLQFKGFINGQEVISENYTVASDCCHVRLVSGNIELVFTP